MKRLLMMLAMAGVLSASSGCCGILREICCWKKSIFHHHCEPCGYCGCDDTCCDHCGDHCDQFGHCDHCGCMGCGEKYIDEWISDPPCCCDPCDCCGNYTGPMYTRERVHHHGGPVEHFDPDMASTARPDLADAPPVVEDSPPTPSAKPVKSKARVAAKPAKRT